MGLPAPPRCVPTFGTERHQHPSAGHPKTALGRDRNAPGQLRSSLKCEARSEFLSHPFGALELLLSITSPLWAAAG